MTQLMYEFFRPRVSLPIVIPVGVIAQDDSGVAYRAIHQVELPDKEEREFYGLDRREEFMNQDFLPRVAWIDPATGEEVALGKADRRLLGVLRERGSHHFLYTPVEERQGPAEDVASSEAKRLEDKQTCRELVLRFADEVTRSVLEALT